MLELTLYVSYCNVHAVRRLRISLDGCFLSIFGPLAGDFRAGQQFVRTNAYMCLDHCFNACTNSLCITLQRSCRGALSNFTWGMFSRHVWLSRRQTVPGSAICTYECVYAPYPLFECLSYFSMYLIAMFMQCSTFEFHLTDVFSAFLVLSPAISVPVSNSYVQTRICALTIVSMLALTLYVSHCNVHAEGRFRISLGGCFLGMFGCLARELGAGQQFVRTNAYMCLDHCFNV